VYDIYIYITYIKIYIYIYIYSCLHVVSSSMYAFCLYGLWPIWERDHNITSPGLLGQAHGLAPAWALSYVRNCFPKTHPEQQITSPIS